MDELNETLLKEEESLLNCTFTENFDIFPPELVGGNFIELLQTNGEEVFGKYLSQKESSNLESVLRKSVKEYLGDQPELARQVTVLSQGISCLLAFVQVNCTGPPLISNDISVLLPWLICPGYDLNNEIASALVLDGECLRSPIKLPLLLLLAKSALVCDLPDLKSLSWWRLRCLVWHQEVLEENSPALHEELLDLADQLLVLWPKPELHLELAQMHLMYHSIVPALTELQAALKAAGITLDLSGALGKRTRYQQKELAQLLLKVDTINIEEDEGKEQVLNATQQLPVNVALQDDVRLEKISFSDSADNQSKVLSAVRQVCVFTAFLHAKKSQPKDNLADEELKAYLSCILDQQRVWGLQLSALLSRCKLEGNHSRTVERAMTQAEALLTSVDAAEPPVKERLPWSFTSALPARWQIESELANLLISLGCVSSALEVFLRLQSWEDVIGCYIQLQLRHKAAEIIREELEKKETVKMWCLLGDATDDVDCYRKAWEFSKERSGRAQRHWGNYYFGRKQYAESIPHYQKSVVLNSLQISVWIRLGFAALEVGDWETSAAAYRRYCTLDPENFEAWNNLAKAYVKLGQKNRAWKALQEALKWNYENWRLWENVMIVSVDCGVMDEVIRSYHRLLDLRGKHTDVEVLKILTNAIINDLPAFDGKGSKRLLEKSLTLMGRLTSVVLGEYKIWHLYSQLTGAVTPLTPETHLKSIQLLQKAQRLAANAPNWIGDKEKVRDVLHISISLSKESLDYSKAVGGKEQSLSALSSARLAVNSLLARMKKEHWDLVTDQWVQDFATECQDLEESARILTQECNIVKGAVA